MHVKVRGVLHPVYVNRDCPLGVRPQHFGKTRMCSRCDHNKHTNSNCAWQYEKAYSETSSFAMIYRISEPDRIRNLVIEDKILKIDF